VVNSNATVEFSVELTLDGSSQKGRRAIVRGE
jgi:hypothetical protein